MTLRHGGCPEMTRSIGLVERMRWMAALSASALLAIAVAVALHQIPAIQAGSATNVSSPGGSSAPLDPRIAGIAAQHPGQIVEAIVQFKGGVTVERSRWDVTRASGHVVGGLHILNAPAVKLTSPRARWPSGDLGV